MAPASTSAEVPESAALFTRLYITPFDLSLQNVVIPSSILPRARNLSYHTIETFPEKRFGFVDLPTMDAENLKKKLNGAVLKGVKVRVETARPEPIPEPAAATGTAKTKQKEGKKTSTKRKHEIDMVEGIQLRGRKVKRGWTTTEQEMVEEKRERARKGKKDDKASKDEKGNRDAKGEKTKKKKATFKSKYTNEPECLFKTRLPDARPLEAIKETGGIDAEEASSYKKKRTRKSDREVIVHEFEKTTKYPTFLKSNFDGASAEATTYQDGVGWVDGTGKVVEPVKSKRRPEGIPAPIPSKAKKEATSPPKQEDSDETSSTSSLPSSSNKDNFSSSSGSDIADRRLETAAPTKHLGVETQAMSSPSTVKRPESARPKSSGSVTSLSIKIPPTTPATKKIHPLEALYKRPQGEDGAANSVPGAGPFSFFGNEDDTAEDDDSMAPASQAPMTPFTKQEFEFRNIRSAAPTPDTAHPSRSFNFWASQGSRDDDRLTEDHGDEGPEDVEEHAQAQAGEDADMVDGVADAQASQTLISDFQRQFWESRGELNRAWRKRKKSAAKEKRYGDNRARAARAI